MNNNQLRNAIYYSVGVGAPTKQEQKKMNGWRSDPRMVFLANPYRVKPDGTRVARDLTKKEREEWERNIEQYQVRYEPSK